MTKKAYEAAYHVTERLDDEFRAAVVKQFGRKNAGEMRYRSSLHNAETKAAAERYWIAANVLCDCAVALRAA